MFMAVITACFIILVVLMKTNEEEIKFPGQEMYEQPIEEVDTLK